MVLGGDSRARGHEFESQHLIQDWLFFIFNCFKIVATFEKTKWSIKEFYTRPNRCKAQASLWWRSDISILKFIVKTVVVTVTIIIGPKVYFDNRGVVFLLKDWTGVIRTNGRTYGCRERLHLKRGSEIKNWPFWAVAVAHWAERSLPRPEIRGSKPALSIVEGGILILWTWDPGGTWIIPLTIRFVQLSKYRHGSLLIKRSHKLAR